jgi:VIT1/CCC1 family predicted Fe2+/Mn2+ transporter
MLVCAMPTTPHIEKHFAASDTVRDIVIGMADGLTVPFALAAGLSGAVASSHLIIVAGLAEIAAGAIAMGLGGYLAARTDAQHYHSERAREWHEVEHLADHERQEVADIFRGYGLSGPQLESVVTAISAHPERWVEFMMRHELGLEAPNPRRAPVSALTIGGSYLLGGLVPLLAYFFIPDPHRALLVSVAVTGLALAVFGGIKAAFTGVRILQGSFETLLVGGLAAAIAFIVAHTIAQ